MALNVYYDKDADLSLIQGKQVAILGYGSQGHAHALNLHDSGVSVTVGLREGSGSWKKAEAAGLTVKAPGDAVDGADVIMMLVPDEHQQALYESVVDRIKDGAALAFAHGFNIHFKKIVPPQGVNVFMVAPKGPGHLVRSEFERGRGVPSLLAVHQNPTGDTKEVGLAYASALGAGRAAILETTFKDETETDLFGEQSVLCGGLSALILAGYETLVDAGYPPEMAYFECLHELKLIVDLIYEGGIVGMRERVSDTAEYGDYTRGPRVVNDRTRKEMKKILAEIQSGKFAREWMRENKKGREHFNSYRKESERHPVEETGEHLRKMMSWMKK